MTTPENDEQLLADYVAGHDPETAFHLLVDRYERRIYAVCYRYFGDTADAEDATQETFLRVARRAGTFTGDSRLSTWIYRVATNVCHDLARRRARRPQTPVADIVGASDARAQHGSIGWDPGDPTVAEETANEVQEALLRLDEVSRSLLILVAIEGLTYADAAAALDLPVGTAKSRVHRARARLASLLAPTGGNRAGSGGVPPAESAPSTSTEDPRDRR